MQLELWQMALLVGIGILVAFSMSFIAQTGQSIVIPVVLLLTGDVFLAIATNALNDLLTSVVVGTSYARAGNVIFKKNQAVFLLLASISIIIGAIIVFTTLIGHALGWFLPILVIGFGIYIILKGFPTPESVKRSVAQLARRLLSGKQMNERTQAVLDHLVAAENVQDDDDRDVIGLLPETSRIYKVVVACISVYVGLNSGLAGANSGVIMAIMLVMLHGFPVKKAVATALIMSIGICGFTVLMYGILGWIVAGKLLFDFGISFFIGLGSVTTGLIVPRFIRKLPVRKFGIGISLASITLGAVALVFFFS